MAKRSILILERNEKIRATLHSASKRAGFEPHELNSNDQLYQLLNSHPIDVILTNIAQQGTGTRSLCTILRNDPQYKRFPLIILYGKPGKTSRVDFLNQGADDFVEMPFSPVELMDIVKSRLRPLGDMWPTIPHEADKSSRSQKPKFSIPPLESKGNLEVVPPAAIFARLFIHKESGVLDLIIHKETRTLYFKNGDLVFAETLSKKDDIDQYLARNRAGSGSGKELVAARIQSGGPKSDPNTYALILKESKLLDPQSFSWWLNMYLLDMVADLFIKPSGVYQWQSLDIPEYAAQLSLNPYFTPTVLFEGIRRMKKWWAYRELLPEPTSIPHLAPDFYEKAEQYGLTARETAMMKVVDGKRTLRQIGEMCHIVCPQVENYIYACRQLQLIAFDLVTSDSKQEELDIYQVLDIPDEPESEEASISAFAPDTDGVGSYQTTPTPMNESTHRGVGLSEENIGNTQKKPPLTLVELNFDLTRGSLEDTHILAIFQRCIMHLFTGEITCRKQEIKKTVFWKRGRIISAVSNSVEERLDNFLFRKGMITEDHLNLLRASPAELIGSPNEIIRMKILTIDKLFTAVKEQLETSLFDLLTWREGSYSCLPGVAPDRDSVPLDVSAQELVLSALHTAAISSCWLDQLPAKTVFYGKKPLSEQAKGVSLTPLERRISNTLSEPFQVSTIFRMLDYPENDILLSLFTLEMADIIKRFKPL
ncbi:MAG: DUF4388 domain-containing protein [bacterium]